VSGVRIPPPLVAKQADQTRSRAAKPLVFKGILRPFDPDPSSQLRPDAHTSDPNRPLRAVACAVVVCQPTVTGARAGRSIPGAGQPRLGNPAQGPPSRHRGDGTGRPRWLEAHFLSRMRSLCQDGALSAWERAGEAVATNPTISFGDSVRVRSTFALAHARGIWGQVRNGEARPYPKRKEHSTRPRSFGKVEHLRLLTRGVKVG